MSFRLANDPWFVQAYGARIHRRQVPIEIVKARNSLIPVMKARLVGADVTLILDGWTNCRHAKMLNLLILQGTWSFFWKTTPLKYGKAAAIMIEVVKIAVREYEQELGVTTVGVVADNESANKALFGLIRAWRPWVL